MTLLVRALIVVGAASSMIPVSSFVRCLPPSALRQGATTTSLVRGGRPVLLVRRPNSSRPAFSSPSTSTTAEAGRTDPASGGGEVDRRRRDPVFASNTGGLRRLPVVKAPKELADKARRVARCVKADVRVSNARARARKHGAESINALIQALCVPLRDVVRGYRREWNRLHPFERVVADLTSRSREKRDGITLQGQLDDIHEARKMVLELGKDWIAKVKGAETAREAGECLKEATEALLRCFDEFAAPPVTAVLETQRALRSAPVVQLDTPAVVAVGAPNVGKSSIIRAVSSATPEVNNYPFTTRGMTLGHVEVFWASDSPLDVARAIVPPRETGRRTTTRSARHPVGADNASQAQEEAEAGRYAFSQLCQVMDSPGLLSRPDEERNEMEALTLAAMQHLPTAVMYVMDLSGAAGDKCSSVADQLALRREMRSRFPRRPWIDVLSKVDLGIVDGAEDELREILDGAPLIELSIHEGTGVQELRMQILRMLGEVRLVLDAMSAAERHVQP